MEYSIAMAEADFVELVVAAMAEVEVAAELAELVAALAEAAELAVVGAMAEAEVAAELAVALAVTAEFAALTEVVGCGAVAAAGISVEES